MIDIVSNSGFAKTFFASGRIKEAFFSDAEGNPSPILEIYCTDRNNRLTQIDGWLRRSGDVLAELKCDDYTSGNRSPASIVHEAVKLLKGYYEITIVGGGGGGAWKSGS